MPDGSGAIADHREEVRGWPAANCPPGMRNAAQAGEEAIGRDGRRRRFESDAQRVWLERIATRGRTAPRWPREHGGGGLSRAGVKNPREEMASIGARAPLESFGLWRLDPAPLRFGSEEQKRRHLPPIARGEDAGEQWTVTGQEVWTSYADRADTIFALVRTDRGALKHEGASLLPIDMESESGSTRPIRLIAGTPSFCETFLDRVRVPKTDTVDRRGQGWETAKHLLTHERKTIGGGARGLPGGRRLAAVAVADDPVARAKGDTPAFALTAERHAGAAAGSDASALLKFHGTELNQRRREIMMAAAGSDALTWDGRGGLAPERPRTEAERARVAGHALGGTGHHAARVSALGGA